MDRKEKVWLRFLCAKGLLKRTQRNERVFAGLERQGLVTRTIGGYWMATQHGVEADMREMTDSDSVWNS